MRAALRCPTRLDARAASPSPEGEGAYLRGRFEPGKEGLCSGPTKWFYSERSRTIKVRETLVPLFSDLT